ncbi:MAG: RAMP superfamily CRISPR-associated protein [Candidatus Cloacimonetes bacterium]|jgi:hypothetical protein|nr:RAMP superfamily CRISPR-associated protein [Candidatus Cloacimonadota bacterium]
MNSTHKGKDASTDKTNIPYGFIPVCKSNLEYKTKQKLDTYSDDLYSGYMNCKLYVLNELLVGNRQISKGKRSTEVYPLCIKDKIIIPASTLKSCVANFMAAYLGYPLNRIDESKYGFKKKRQDNSDSCRSQGGKSIEDFEKDYCEYDKAELANDKLNMIEEIFGYSISDKSIEHEKRAKSGKVHFSYAVADSDYKANKINVNMPFPGSPYTALYKFYMRDSKPKDSAPRNNALRLKGRKFFYRTKDKPSMENKPNEVFLKDVLRADKEVMPFFTFRVYFENLEAEELRTLCYCLNMGQNWEPVFSSIIWDKDKDKAYIKDSETSLLCHQIGYGKNYGMGAVKIVLEERKNKVCVIRVKMNKETRKLGEWYFYPSIEKKMSDELKDLSYLYAL